MAPDSQSAATAWYWLARRGTSASWIVAVGRDGGARDARPSGPSPLAHVQVDVGRVVGDGLRRIPHQLDDVVHHGAVDGEDIRPSGSPRGSLLTCPGSRGARGFQRSMRVLVDPAAEIFPQPP